MFHGDLLGERARITPSRTALVEVATGRRFTYADLDRRATRAASSVRALGVDPTDRVGLLSHNRVEFLDVFFAAPKGGFIVVPLGTRSTASEIAAIAHDCTMKTLVYENAFEAVVRDLKGLVPGLETAAIDGDALVSGEPAGTGHEARRGNPDDLWCLLYTSGTTGKPKGVKLPNRMIVWNGFNTVASWGLREDDVSPLFTPLYHAGGLGAFLTPIFTVGGRIVLQRAFDAGEVWRTIESEKATVVLGVPTIWKMLLEHPSFATSDLSSIRWLISGGAPLPHYIIEAYQKRGLVFRQGFGMTEAGVNCFAMTSEDSVRKAGSIGRPMPFMEVRLVDEGGRDVPRGEVGEMLFRGPHVCAGYWNNPEATRTAFDADGWLHTGDLARQDEEGFFYVAGRRKDMFISGGVNVYPAEIEGQLLLHPSVKDAAVCGVEDPRWGETGVAFVVAEATDPLARAIELAAFLRERLAKFKVPRGYVFVPELPRTAYGKVVKKTLTDDLAAGRLTLVRAEA
jgi:fatty-acyl-CoA synthase